MNSWFWFGVSVLSLVAHRTPPPAASKPEFFDQPTFIVAGVTDSSNRGGHGSDVILRSSEALTKATASLGKVDQRADPLETVREFEWRALQAPAEQNLFDWGAELLAHRAYDPAIEVFTRGKSRYPQSTRMLLGLAVAYYAKGSYDQAAQRFCAATDINPSDPGPYLFLAKAQAIADSQGYLERTARFAKLQPANAWANYHYAVALWKQKAAGAEARALLESALQLDPGLALAHLQLGIIDASEKKFTEAIARYQKAIAIDPSLEEAHYRLAQAYLRTGEPTKAHQEFEIHDRLAKESAAAADRERREVQQFVIQLRPDTQKRQ